MATTLIEKFDTTIATICKIVEHYKSEASDVDIYRECIQTVAFQEAFSGPIEFSVEDAFEFAKNSSDCFNDCVESSEIEFDGDIVGFVSKVYKTYLSDVAPEVFYQSQDTAEIAYEKMAEVFGNFLAELSTADIDDYIEFTTKASEAGFVGIATYMAETLCKKAWIDDFGTFIEYGSYSVEDFAEGCDRRNIEMGIYLASKATAEDQASTNATL